MSYTPPNPNGQATSANSAPVVLSSDQPKIPVQINNGQTLTATGSASALNADLFASTDVSNYNFVSVQITGTWSGTISFQASNDNTNWSNLILFNASSFATSGNATVTTNGTYHGGLGQQYFRLRMTAYSSGTASANIIFKTLPPGLHSMGMFGTALPRSTGGLVGARVKSAASTNATLLKSTVAGLYGMTLSNDHATSKRYIKFYNKASAPTVGTDTPIFTLIIPPNTTVDIPVTNLSLSMFSTGIAYAITGAIADSDATAIGADEIHGLVWYA